MSQIITCPRCGGSWEFRQHTVAIQSCPHCRGDRRSKNFTGESPFEEKSGCGHPVSATRYVCGVCYEKLREELEQTRRSAKGWEEDCVREALNNEALHDKLKDTERRLKNVEDAHEILCVENSELKKKRLDGPELECTGEATIVISVGPGTYKLVKVD